MLFFFFKQKTAYEMRISDWSSDVCSSDLPASRPVLGADIVKLLGLPGHGLGRRSGVHGIGLARSAEKPESGERQLALAMNLAADLGDVAPLPHHFGRKLDLLANRRDKPDLSGAKRRQPGERAGDRKSVV